MIWKDYRWGNIREGWKEVDEAAKDFVDYDKLHNYLLTLYYICIYKIIFKGPTLTGLFLKNN